MSSFTAGVIVIGDEILSGRTQDTNSNYIAKKLLEAGIKLEEVIVIYEWYRYLPWWYGWCPWEGQNWWVE